MWDSMGAVADRDFVTEFLAWGTMFMGHISRLSEDLIFYSTAELGFKKNPDGLELLRGKAGRAFGHFAGVYCATKGIPSAYNKDLQESWEPMLDHVKTISDSVQIANGILSTLKLRPERMTASLNSSLLANRRCRRPGRVVAKSEELGITMDQLSLEQLQTIDSRFPDNIKDVFNYEASVESRSAQGGTSQGRVLEQIEVLKGMLA
ncbi:argininosuccinate lyase [Fusarium bulbicola]|nr:argininosuccinate lyase [Fusarium bulbicola]